MEEAKLDTGIGCRGVEQMEARQAHYLQVGGSNPSATNNIY